MGWTSRQLAVSQANGLFVLKPTSVILRTGRLAVFYIVVFQAGLD